MNFISYGRQAIDEDDIAAVISALRSDFLTCGPEVKAFARETATKVGVMHALADFCAMAPLHACLVVT